MKAEKLAGILLREAPVLHLATSDKSGKPSNCALEFAKEKGLFYWRSTKGSQHSKNLLQRKSCAICVTRTNDDGSGEGIQSYGKAVLLNKQADVENAKRLLDTEIKRRVLRILLSLKILENIGSSHPPRPFT
jgi:nitroimidazol reductase NimA-like FMN-containing flavoprotein (pyridoxamine 5'-phosphate oxidase superfamily)